MPEEETTPAGSSPSVAASSYPGDLVRFVRERWEDASDVRSDVDLLPDAKTLEDFFSGCYHASMLREEERPVTFRAIFAAPTRFTQEGRPPEGLLSLEFSRSLPFHANELRRLSVAADPHRTLIGVWREAEEGLRIWGVINSGTRWLRNVQGGRLAGSPLPQEPVVYAHAPGRIEVYKGYELVGNLQMGTLSGSRMDIFDSKWLPIQFTQFRSKIQERHDAARKLATELRDESWASIEPTLSRRIAERMLKRVIAILRDARHGGTIIFIPLENSAEPSTEESYIDLRYRLADGGPRLSFPILLVDILNRLAQLYGTLDRHGPGPVGWREFEATTDDEIATLDEGLFEMAHLIAGLAAADGAVVLSQDHALLGFGGMISGRHPDVARVARALDLEGETVVEEETGNVGARHRSAYRLASALHGSLAVVISQDGGVRFVCQKDGRVTYWDQE